MIRFQCPGCKGLLQVHPELAGSPVACGRCRMRLRVPGAAQVTAAPPPPPPPPTATRRARPPVPKPAPRPAPEKRSWLTLVVTAGVGALVALGGVGLTYGLWADRKSSPQDQAEARATERPPAAEVKPTTPPKRPDQKEKEKDPVAPPPPPPSPPPPPQVKDPPQPEVTTAPPEVKADDEVVRALKLLNAQRREDGAAEVRLHPEHTRGCTEHAAYLAKHWGGDDDAHLDPHTQDRRREGATADGLAAAAVAHVARKSPAEAMRAWLVAPAHRALLLSRSLKTLGVGVARDAEGRPVVVCDLHRGRSPLAGEIKPVLYPADGQGDVPLAFPGNEVPDPLPLAKNKLGGYPITATFPASLKLSAARAWLEDEDGQDVKLHFSSPARPANEKHVTLQQNTLCLIAHRPLRLATRYTVRVEAATNEGEYSRSWSFVTLSREGLYGRMYRRAVAQVNHFRKASGLPEVALDDGLTRAAESHARYIARHLHKGAGPWISDENPEWDGYTPEGQKIARACAIRLGGGNGPADAVDWMMSSVLNRHLVLLPPSRKVAFGAAQQAPRGWVWLYHAQTESFSVKKGTKPILYPGPGQADVPLELGWEVTNMLPRERKDHVAGFPITARVLGARDIRMCSAQLTDPDGKDVPCWTSTPESPLPATGGYKQLILLPKAPLRPATTYRVAMSAELDGEEWRQSWRFTTSDREAYRKETARAVVERVNAARKLAGLPPVRLDPKLSKGCQAHAEYVVRHLGNPKVEGLNIHEEDPSLPGYTEEGMRAGRLSVIALLPDPADSVAGWLATLYHRIPVLRAGVERVGYGQALHPFRGWVTVLDLGSGRRPGA